MIDNSDNSSTVMSDGMKKLFCHLPLFRFQVCAIQILFTNRNKLLLDTEQEVKPCRGRQRKTWRKVILLLQLNIDSQEILAEDYIS